MFILIVPVVLGVIVYWFITRSVTSPGRAMQRKFVSLGNMKGKSLNQIESVVGRHSSVSEIGNGKVLYQWMATGYHIAIQFDKGICEKITHQYSAK